MLALEQTRTRIRQEQVVRAQKRQNELRIQSGKERGIACVRENTDVGRQNTDVERQNRDFIVLAVCFRHEERHSQ
jgi:hypothetical protein